ncbi:lipopolysaccharide biosynthesis protein [Butyrivibrio sp.]|uniref:lipopolysaccharide biosynthesis protein n=1 Tax=Butyrivibrio sp. TaxID=28121 RepID=UPI0025B8FB40|nr:hypothetical protein [Butyrivibrio sp.]MBE5838867.1 hypothetical protein [Butyrivibrio sp.]
MGIYKYNDSTIRAKTNVIITFICQVIFIIISFVCRTVFAYVLGAKYLGINGLFNNVLYVLSFVELGIGNAFARMLYKPLHDHDDSQIRTHLFFCRKMYCIIVFAIFVLGMAIIPFIKFLMNEDFDYGNIFYLYLLFLADTLISYAFVYKKTLLIADQKNYTVELFALISNICCNVLQIVILYFTYSFELYLSVKVLVSLLCNFLISLRADKEYPEIKDFVKNHGEISRAEKLKFRNDVKGLFMEKIASVSFNGTDNIFMTAYSGITTVGIVSQYTLILTAINSFLSKIYSPLTSTLGHLSVNQSKASIEKIFRKIYFFNSAVYGLFFCGLLLLIQQFVSEIWLNDQYFLSTLPVALLVIEVCIRGIHYPVFMARSAFGIFSEKRFVFVICAVLNIVLDFLLGSKLGISGIFMATIISRAIAYLTDVFVLYTYGFKMSCVKFILFMGRIYISIILAFMIVRIAVMTLQNLSSIERFVSSFFVVVFLYSVLFTVMSINTPEGSYFMKKIIGRVLRKT